MVRPRSFAFWNLAIFSRPFMNMISSKHFTVREKWLGYMIWLISIQGANTLSMSTIQTHSRFYRGSTALCTSRRGLESSLDSNWKFKIGFKRVLGFSAKIMKTYRLLNIIFWSIFLVESFSRLYWRVNHAWKSNYQNIQKSWNPGEKQSSSIFHKSSKLKANMNTGKLISTSYPKPNSLTST